MLNEVLIDHLMDKLFVPYYIHSLAPPDKYIIVETEEVNISFKYLRVLNVIHFINNTYIVCRCCKTTTINE